MPAVNGANLVSRFLMKDLLPGNSLACRRPHVRGIDILPAIVIDIGPARAHAGPRVINVGLA
jgi:hypothetical protein